MRKSTVLVVLLTFVGLLCAAGLLVHVEVFRLAWFVSGSAPAVEYGSAIVQYLEGTGDLPTVLTAEERTHMEDVRGVFWLGRYALALAGIVICLLSLKDVAWERVLSRTSTALFVLPVVVVVLFPITFTLSHYLLFSPGSWIFDPWTTTLVNVFPERFFLTLGVFWLILCATLGFIARYSRSAATQE